MRVANAIIYKGNRREEVCQLLPRADAIREAQAFAEMIAQDEFPRRAPGRVTPLAPAWPFIAGFEIKGESARYVVKVRDQGRL